MQLSKNFNTREFNNVEPEDHLIIILQDLRDITDESITITDSTRTIEEHIQIYKGLYGHEWLKHIPWKSRHLAKFNKKLRAVDIKAKKGAGFWSGKKLAAMIKNIASNYGFYVGIGTGKEFIHIDVDRHKDAEWKYNY